MTGPKRDTWPASLGSHSRQNTHLGRGLGYGRMGTRPTRRAGKTRTRDSGSCRIEEVDPGVHTHMLA